MSRGSPEYTARPERASSAGAKQRGQRQPTACGYGEFKATWAERRRAHAGAAGRQQGAQSGQIPIQCDTSGNRLRHLRSLFPARVGPIARPRSGLLPRHLPLIPSRPVPSRTVALLCFILLDTFTYSGARKCFFSGLPRSLSPCSLSLSRMGNRVWPVWGCWRGVESGN